MPGIPVEPDRQVLVPLSLAELGESKIPVAVVQAKAYGAQIMLLHVISSARKDQPEVDATESMARSYLEMIAARLRSEGVEAHLLVRYGPVGRTILQEIRARRTDLVVMGTDVRPGLAKTILGSIANEVVAKAPCPVMLVKPDVGKVKPARAIRSFSEDLRRTGPVSPFDLGLRMVDPGRIVGSVTRADELDNSFKIRKPSRLERERYERLLEAMRRGEPFPPLGLFKLGYGYYVLEGHRRTAAAKELGLTEIEAEVRDFVPAADALRRQVFVERREFEAATGLTRLAAALPGHYDRFRKIIESFARQKRIEDLREAAELWASTVYWPAARVIRTSGWGQYFPDLRTADIFLLLSDSVVRLSSEKGREVGWQEALVDLLPGEKIMSLPATPRQRLSGAVRSVLGR